MIRHDAFLRRRARFEMRQRVLCVSLLAAVACSEPESGQEPQAALPAPLEPSASANAQPVAPAASAPVAAAPVAEAGTAPTTNAPVAAAPAADAATAEPAEPATPPVAAAPPTSGTPATPAAPPTSASDAKSKEQLKPAQEPAPAPKAEAAPAMPAAAAPTPEAKLAAQPVTSVTYQVEPAGRVSFLIDAPLEKIKGGWSRTGGQLKVDVAKLDQTRGEVTMDLSTLKITTFPDSGQNDTQAHHALNWMEIGGEVAADARARFRTATFRIDQVLSAAPASLGEGVAQATAVVEGTMTLHGITSTHQVEVQVVAEGDPKAPSALRITSRKPLRLSLKHHDVKPRDLAGRFLAGALEQVGQKISDTVLVSLDFKATRP